MSFLPPVPRQIKTKSSFVVPKDDRIRFRISMPNSELRNLKGDFLMVIEEVPSPTSVPVSPRSPISPRSSFSSFSSSSSSSLSSAFSPSKKTRTPHTPHAPLKYIIHGSQSASHPEDAIYKIRFYEVPVDPATGTAKTGEESGFGFAAVEWVGEVPKDLDGVYYYDGRMTFPELGLEDHGITEFVVRGAEQSIRKAQVRVTDDERYQVFEEIIRRQGVAEHHFSAIGPEKTIGKGDREQDTKQPGRPIPIPPMTTIDLWKASRETDEYSGAIEIHYPTSCIGTGSAHILKGADSEHKSLWVKPLVVWLVLSVLQRDVDEFLVFEMDGEMVDIIPRPKVKKL